eukprot:m.1025203 g.1025203  ORF g.1025203 m.1025203 type:complete len:182 (-) comp24103_c0_seq16:2622-3167(-)
MMAASGVIVFHDYKVDAGVPDFQESLTQQEARVNFFVACGIVGLCGLFVLLGGALIACKKKSMSRSMAVLWEAVLILQQRLGIAVFTLGILLLFLGTIAAFVYAQLSLWGGCDYRATFDAQHLLSAWSYDCPSVAETFLTPTLLAASISCACPFDTRQRALCGFFCVLQGRLLQSFASHRT